VSAIRKLRTRKTIKIVIPLIAFFFIVFGIPHLAPIISSPSGTYSDVPNKGEVFLSYWGINDDDLTVKTITDMQVLGTKDTRGYVNMLDTEDIIYLRPFEDPKYYNYTTKLYSATVTHEYAHILQKRLVEKVSNGDDWDRYFKLLELDALLSENAPELKEKTDNSHKHDVPFLGLETNADCILHSYSTSNTFSYVHQESGCNSYQMGEARAIMEEEWPSPENAKKWESVIEKEKSELMTMNRAATEKKLRERQELRGSGKTK
jgi:hypothetical protein